MSELEKLVEHRDALLHVEVRASLRPGGDA